MNKEYNYWVEVRQDIGWPEGNYTEEHYEFDTKKKDNWSGVYYDIYGSK